MVLEPHFESRIISFSWGILRKVVKSNPHSKKLLPRDSKLRILQITALPKLYGSARAIPIIKALNVKESSENLTDIEVQLQNHILRS